MILFSSMTWALTSPQGIFEGGYGQKKERELSPERQASSNWIQLILQLILQNIKITKGKSPVGQ